ncbi:hypothetical protein [Pseudomonas citri]|uniref:hypothetical protein n=1 Tax=Pseudomonas citri TaxID=2978349 RepID=UPI0021B62B62|nr:hypothetical protein [Pseudomonas citri]
MDIDSIVHTLTSQNSLRDKIVIDCGHTPIFSSHDGYSFGIKGEPSPTEFLTFKLGVKLHDALKRHDKQVSINLYLSDLIGIKGGNDERRKIHQDIQHDQKTAYIPNVYKNILAESGIPLDNVTIHLQSKGNDLFRKIMRRTRSGLELLKSTHTNYIEETFKKTNSLLLSTEDQSMFSLTTPYLFDTDEEDAYFGGSWWKSNESQIKQSDLENCPMARLKKNPVINLYETGGRVLCPATYGGLLCQYDNSVDHIAIYARADDEFVGEKVYRGVISANLLIDNFSRNCAQIIINNEELVEHSFFEKDTLGRSDMDSTQFTKQIQDMLQRNNMELI